MELALLILATVGVGLLIFAEGDDLPVGFAALLVVAWVGYRFSPLGVTLYNLLFTVGVVLLTFGGFGPFAALPDPWAGAALVQFFAGVCCTVALMLSLGVAERRELEAVLAEHEAEQRVRRNARVSPVRSTTPSCRRWSRRRPRSTCSCLGQARHNIGEASRQARDWIGELYDDKEVLPGAAVRREPAKLEAGRADG